MRAQGLTPAGIGAVVGHAPGLTEYGREQIYNTRFESPLDKYKPVDYEVDTIGQPIKPLNNYKYEYKGFEQDKPYNPYEDKRYINPY